MMMMMLLLKVIGVVDHVGDELNILSASLKYLIIKQIVFLRPFVVSISI